MKNTARNLIEKLHGLEVTLWAEGDALHYKAPAGAIPSDVLESLKRNKQDVIQLLATLPAFTPEQEKTLIDFYCQQPRERRLAIHRRGVELRRERSWPHYTADLSAMDEAWQSAGKPSGPFTTATDGLAQREPEAAR